MTPEHNQLDPAPKPDPEAEVMSELLQLGLDIGGVLDQTGFCDLSSGIMSAGQGDFLGAFINLLSLAPLGDVAKVLKTDKYLKTISKAIELAKTDARAAKELRPALQSLADAIRALPLSKLPDDVARPLRKLQKQLDDFCGATPKGKLERHHSDPIFMGGNPNQQTTPMPKEVHRGSGDSLHNDLNDFLRGKTDAAGNHMRPQPGNPADRIQGNFSAAERQAALAEFYNKFRDKYPDAARDFFNQHPDLR